MRGAGNTGTGPASGLAGASQHCHRGVAAPAAAAVGRTTLPGRLPCQLLLGALVLLLACGEL